MLHIDVETRSTTPIQLGVWRYLQTAELLCMGWAIDDGEPQVWTPGDPFPARVDEYIRSGGTCVAHNAEFEALVFATLLPRHAPSLAQWQCTATMAAACGLPRSLAAACDAAGVPQRKDARGTYLINMLCIPPYVYDHGLSQELYEYCRQDVRAERELYRVLRKPTPEEQSDWLANYTINLRGLPIDVKMAEAGARMAAVNREQAEAQLSALTDGALSKVAGVHLLRWVNEQLGTERETLDKHDRLELLSGDLPRLVREVLTVVDETAYSSVGKYSAAARRTSPDGRLRGSYMLNGAGQTGRYSSTGLQVHNLPRLDTNQVLAETGFNIGQEDHALEALCSQIASGVYVPQAMLAAAVRPLVSAPEGRLLVWGDWSAIEGRILPWLADTEAADRKLDLYWDKRDVYVHTAAAMHTLDPGDVTPAQRQEGKVAELALGYGGGVGALHSMARNYRLVFSDAAAERIVAQWRNANGWAVDYWSVVERAFLAAFSDPGTNYAAGLVTYRYIPETRTVWCMLPSGRLLAYRDVRYTPKPESRRRPHDPPGERELTCRRDRGRIPLWRGLLVENITQAVAADVLRQTLRENYQALYIIGHTHDEIIVECDEDAANATEAALQAAMETVPEWAEGLPLVAKIERGWRYAK